MKFVVVVVIFVVMLLVKKYGSNLITWLIL